ncbi:receptor-type tyrosine-protein phosphatase F-like [Amphiura filiformis]|uniref:receptor-type tyrosine-protein phosphatase F-like n=1 Tax=Amphiura filiformis TaxID=82378 RepID=UPI003B213E8E
MVIDCKAFLVGKIVANGKIQSALAASGDPQSTQRTTTANVGESIILEVTATRSDVLWNKDGTHNGNWDNQKQVIIDPVGVGDAGIYECYFQGERKLGTQAIMRLIVRECSARLWNPPACNQSCPYCYNGGVCDDKTGVCICAPGFSGTSCETAWGRNTFGQDGYYHCSGQEPNYSPGCRNKLLCPLDPVGCLCASGFMGPDCLDECPEGSFGADCTQTCHCASGGSDCDTATGACINHGCSLGWTGSNCQGTTTLTFAWDEVECGSRGGIHTYKYSINTAPPTTGTTTSTSQVIDNLLPCTTYEFQVKASTSAGDGPQTNITASTQDQVPEVLGLIVSQVSDESGKLDVSWDPDPCAEQYSVYYQLINRDQCDNQYVPMEQYWGGSETSIIIDGLLAYSTYDVIVRAINSMGYSESTAMDTTYITAPSGPPADVRNSSRTNTSLSFEWDRVLCGKRGGPNIFLYELRDVNSNPINSGSTPDIYVTFMDLDSCTEYQFRVKASNDVGDGLFSNYVIWETDNGVLEPVQNLQTSAITSGTWTLLWDADIGSKCKADEYFIEYALINMDQCETYTDPMRTSFGRVPDTTVEIDGLQSHSTYQVYVYPMNDFGTGEERQLEDSTKDSAPSGKPEKLTVVEIGKTFLSYEWDQPQCGSRNGIISLYKYTLTPGEEGSIDETSVNMTNLTPCTLFTFSILAINDQGEGPSRSVERATKSDGMLT